MKPTPHLKLSFFIFCCITCITAGAQRSLKYENGGGPSGNGPSTTNKVVTMYYGDAGVYSPPTTVTYSISNQQYPGIEGNSGTPGLVFGGGNNNSANSPVGGAVYYSLINSLGASTNGHYSTGGATPAVNVANDYSIQLTGFSDALLNANGSNKVATNSKNVYYADLTLTFNRPVNNPVLHITGLGGTTNSSNGQTLGLALRFELTSAGFSVSRLSGNFAFNVSGTTIRNSSARYNGGTNNSSPSGASGSVRINGSQISTLTFRVAMDGDGGGNTWGLTNRVTSDAILVSVSLATYSLSGTVFNDANGLSDNTVNGTGTNAGGLNAVLIAAGANTVAAVVPVNADGTYTFNNNVLAGDYSVELTTENATVDEAPPPVRLPDGWAATGEHLGSGSGNDGTPDGILTGITVNSNVTEANFGINQQPVTDDFTQTIPIPRDNSIPAGTIDGSISGSDPDDGQLGNGNSVVITELPENGTLLYNGQPVTAGQPIENFDPRLLSFTDLQDGTTFTSFKFSFLDAAGNQSATPATFTVSWEGALAVAFGPVTARVSNGTLVLQWSTLEENNNDYFEVEVSKDGKKFIAIGTVRSRSNNGNSNAPLEYSFSRSLNEVQTFGGLILFLSILGWGFFRKKKQLLSASINLMIFCGTLLMACQKTALPPAGENELFVRIVQVDKDGTKSYSRIIKVNLKEPD
ncbi:hypothetical protein [Niabella beijingensis]|uniref:hypothetical protein n=1 Tax=Niabella beijingensis TaxID=2872700 RepID=UPI001CBC50F3|nr:hypothetical protein [Niabella beijingensis]MBZ4192503.1 hypothetical protein [Niabella beijingensis]